ncbi:ATP-binding protein [Frankia canadensis]|uniref:ATP-binding protein n=1 Tax=Frankia canadensis TaxID=1836972 RepID=UPI003C2F22CF
MRRGYGLGLAIVRAVVDSHGGHLSAAPGPDGGLDLHIVLPPAGAGSVFHPDGPHSRRTASAQEVPSSPGDAGATAE